MPMVYVKHQFVFEFLKQDRTNRCFEAKGQDFHSQCALEGL